MSRMLRTHSLTTPYLRSLVTAVLAASIACGGGSDTTSPSGGDSNTGGSAKPTHPEGTLGTRITLSSEADGVAIDSSGMAFVAMNFEGAVARFRIDAPTPLATPVAVGNIAQDVVVNRAGTTAYVAAAAARARSCRADARGARAGVRPLAPRAAGGRGAPRRAAGRRLTFAAIPPHAAPT